MKATGRQDTRAAMPTWGNDWFGDAALRLCSLAARGLWWEMCLVAWKAPERGLLVTHDAETGTIRPMTTQELAKIVQERRGTVDRLLAELGGREVYSVRESDGAIYCRRMVREAENGACRTDGTYPSPRHTETAPSDPAARQALSAKRSAAGLRGALAKHGKSLANGLAKPVANVVANGLAKSGNLPDPSPPPPPPPPPHPTPQQHQNMPQLGTDQPDTQAAGGGDGDAALHEGEEAKAAIRQSFSECGIADPPEDVLEIEGLLPDLVRMHWGQIEWEVGRGAKLRNPQGLLVRRLRKLLPINPTFAMEWGRNHSKSLANGGGNGDGNGGKTVQELWPDGTRVVWHSEHLGDLEGTVRGAVVMLDGGSAAFLRHMQGRLERVGAAGEQEG